MFYDEFIVLFVVDPPCPSVEFWLWYACCKYYSRSFISGFRLPVMLFGPFVV